MSSGEGPNPLRQALWPLATLYGAVAAARNALFSLGWKTAHRLDVPVVSVGNLTVGGTGKTPTVAWLCQLAKDAGRTPGVLARGYGRAPSAALNDEGVLLQRRLPWLLQEQDPDRVAAGRRLVERGADFVVLDDGFQHRRLHRDLDVVCLDARLPFGNGHCLPAGDLREFRSGLRRADLLLLTRADALGRDQLAARVARLRQLSGKPAIPVHACAHAPSDVVDRPSGAVAPARDLDGARGAAQRDREAYELPRHGRGARRRGGAGVRAPRPPPLHGRRGGRRARGRSRGGRAARDDREGRRAPRRLRRAASRAPRRPAVRRRAA